MKRYLSLYGPNTHQLWLYDEEKDVYIDPPLHILYELDKMEDIETAQKRLEEIANNDEPDWLHDGNEYHELEP